MSFTSSNRIKMPVYFLNYFLIGYGQLQRSAYASDDVKTLLYAFE